MKKTKVCLVIFSLIFLLSGCTDIKDRIFINSLGLDYKDDEYTIYLYTKSASNNAQFNELGGDSISGNIAKINGKSLIDLLEYVDKSTYEQISYYHMKSILLTLDFLKSEKIDELFDVLNDDQFFPNNMYTFACESILDIYKLKNMDEVTPQKTLFTDPTYLESKMNTPLIHILEFATSYYEKNFVRIPYIEVVDDIWEDDSDKKYTNLLNTGLFIINKEETFLYKEEDLDLRFLFNKDEFHLSIDDYTIRILKYKISYKIKKEVLMFKISFSSHRLIGNPDFNVIEEYIEKQIKKAIELELFDVNSYLYRFSKKWDNSVNINVKIKKDF